MDASPEIATTNTTTTKTPKILRSEDRESTSLSTPPSPKEYQTRSTNKNER